MKSVFSVILILISALISLCANAEKKAPQILAITLNELKFPHPKAKQKFVTLMGNYEVIHSEIYQVHRGDSTITLFFDSKLPVLDRAGIGLSGNFTKSQILKIELTSSSAQESFRFLDAIRSQRVLDLRSCKDFIPKQLVFSYFDQYPIVSRCHLSRLINQIH